MQNHKIIKVIIWLGMWSAAFASYPACADELTPCLDAASLEAAVSEVYEIHDLPPRPRVNVWKKVIETLQAFGGQDSSKGCPRLRYVSKCTSTCLHELFVASPDGEQLLDKCRTPF